MMDDKQKPSDSMVVCEYTPAVLALVCPLCCAAVGGKCLVKTLWGKNYADKPHAVRVMAAEMQQGGKI